MHGKYTLTVDSHSNSEKTPRKPRSTVGIPHSPSMPLREEKKRKERSRPISEHFGTISLSPVDQPPSRHRREKSVDNAM